MSSSRRLFSQTSSVFFFFVTIRPLHPNSSSSLPHPPNQPPSLPPKHKSTHTHTHPSPHFPRLGRPPPPPTPLAALTPLRTLLAATLPTSSPTSSFTLGSALPFPPWPLALPLPALLPPLEAGAALWPALTRLASSSSSCCVEEALAVADAVDSAASSCARSLACEEKEELEVGVR